MEYSNCYEKYYLNQIGGGNDQDHLTFYTGRPFQRGFNIFTRIGKKYGLPLLKYFGKKAFDYGKNVIEDINSGENIKSSIKKNLKRSAHDTLEDVDKMINQSGKRRRIKRRNIRKKYRKPPKSTKRRKLIGRSRKLKSNRKKKNKTRKYKRKSKNIFDFV